VRRDQAAEEAATGESPPDGAATRGEQIASAAGILHGMAAIFCAEQAMTKQKKTAVEILEASAAPSLTALRTGRP